MMKLRNRLYQSLLAILIIALLLITSDVSQPISLVPDEPPTAPVSDEPPTEPAPDQPPIEPAPDQPPIEPAPDQPPTEPAPDEPPTEPVPDQEPIATGNTYYVATDGDNGNLGTEAEPWASPDYADTQVSPGDTVYLRGGIYNEWFTITHSGSPDSVITYINYPGETPIIDGTGLSDPGHHRGVINIEASYIWIEGLEVKGNPSCHGIFSWGGSPWTDITIKDCNVHHNYLGGICISAYHQEPNPITNVTIDGCDIHHNFTGGTSNENISLMYVDGFEIKNCHVHNNYDKEGIDVKNGCVNGSIHDNEVSGSDAVGIYIDGFDRAQSNIDVYNNEIHGCSTGMALAAETGDHAQTNINFYNNLVYNCGGGFSIWLSYKFEKTFTLINNTFYHNSSHQASIGNPAEYNIDCVVRNNIFVAETSDSGLLVYSDYESGGVTIDHNLFYSEDGNYRASNVYGTDYVYDQDPSLTNPVTNFSLAYGSPAIDAGSSTDAPSDDYTGTARPQGAGYDIGAYEYGGLMTLLAVTTNIASGLTKALLPGIFSLSACD